MKEGFVIIDKPIGITSFGVIHALRKITGIKKIGHAGTLDPLASGVLICAIGRSATRQIDLFKNQDKKYIAEIEFGKTSDTYDMEGVIEDFNFKKKPLLKDVKAILEKFMGDIEQCPPIYSAKKINGVRSYKLAREGKVVELKKGTVNISEINVIEYNWPILIIEVSCGKGTYIRSLANDIGEKLCCGGILKNLIRTEIGKFDIKKSVRLDKINSQNWERFLIDDFK